MPFPLDMASRRSIFAVGLADPAPVGPRSVQDAVATSEELRQKVMEGLKKAQDAGYDLEVLQIHLDNIPAALKEVKDKLKSKQWDGFIIGFGIRGTAEYTDVFEKLVNAGREIVPGAKLGFNTRPDDLFECVVRNFEQ